MQRILIVGEAPGAEEERQGKPFVGQSGQELTKMLREAGIDRESCHITNTCSVRPLGNDISKCFTTKTNFNKEDGWYEYKGQYCNFALYTGALELEALIEKLQPRLIISLGNTPLWALTGNTGITSWRGSMIPYKYGWIVPTYHPAGVMRKWDWRPIAVHDLKRAREIYENPSFSQPDYHFIIRPTYEQVVSVLHDLRLRCDREKTDISADLETERPLLSCIGFGWSKTEAICIPFISPGKGSYFTPHEEEIIINMILDLVNHPNCNLIGQNWMSYDTQYTLHSWGDPMYVDDDTMVMQHLIFPGIQKGLDFLSSMYCEYHLYWKDEGKERDTKLGVDEFWTYNCKDAVTTWEVAQVLRPVIEKQGLSDLYHFQLRELAVESAKAGARGILVSKERKEKFIFQVLDAIQQRESLLFEMTGFNSLAKTKNAKPWYRSPIQQMQLFYDILKLPIQKNKKTKRRTADDEALTALKKKVPWLSPLFDALLEYRSLGVFYNVLTSKLREGRLHTTLSPTGTETFRFASSEDPFGYGTNCQNLSKGNE